MLIEILIFPVLVIGYVTCLFIAGSAGVLAKKISKYFRQSTTNLGAKDGYIRP